MPSKSASQHRLMAAVAHNPDFAKKAGIPQSVGRDFTEADKGRKFAKGGDMAKKLPPFMGKESKAEERKEKQVKRMSPTLYKLGEQREKVHGKSGKEKPSKYAEGGGVGLTDKQKMLIKNAKQDEYARQAEKPYNAAMRNTPPAPKEPASAPAKAPIKKAMGGCAKGYADGGPVRGGGREIHGRTKGRFV